MVRPIQNTKTVLKFAYMVMAALKTTLKQGCKGAIIFFYIQHVDMDIIRKFY